MRLFVKQGEGKVPRPCRSAVLHYLAIRSPRAFLTKVRALRSLTPSFAHDSGESALVPAPHPVFCAQFWRKCARSGLRPRVSRTILAKMRASGLVLRRVGSVFAKNAPGKGAGATRPRPCRGTHPAKVLRPCRGTPPQDTSGRSGPPGAVHQERSTMSGPPGAGLRERAN